MNPSSGEAAGREAYELMRRYFRGASAKTKRRRYKTAALVANRIWCRWQAGIYRWQQKHVRWYLEHGLQGCTGNTRYQHFLVVKDLVRIVGREHWLTHLDGAWARPSGERGRLKIGRPPALKGRRKECSIKSGKRD